MSRRVSRIQATITATARIAPAIDEEDVGGHADERDGDADGEQHRLDAAAREVDLLAGGRDLGIERAHEM